MLKLLNQMILVCIIGLIAVTIGISASLWIANYTAQPVLFLISGTIAFIFIYLVGTMIILKHIKNGNHKTYKTAVYTFGGILLLSMALSLLLPLSDEQKKPLAVKGQQYWNLPSGSKIAYVHMPGEGNSPLPPVIFLHGGPAVSDMAGDSSYFGQLAREGYDVYVYDEVGAGLSSRLEDPRDYTVMRDVSDLEAIRQKVEAKKVILIGHSYGGEVVANYLAAYGNHVEKAVFISPGGINPEDTSGGNLISRLTLDEKWRLFKAMLHPRVMMAYGLLQINPVAARNFVGDNEMDARFDIVYRYSRPSLHSRKKSIGPELSGLGFYAHQTPQSATAKPKADIRKALSERDISALIVKGSSDYLSWSSGIDYKKALRNSTLVYFKGAGHNVYQDQPELLMKVLRAFLSGSTLPVEEYQGIAPPEDYEGVR